MHHQIKNTQSREVSSSSDKCKCTHCKNQAEIQLHNKKALPNIHVYHHLKKRQGPPLKKETKKESSIKHKVINKQSEATPAKHKVDRSKEAYNALVAQQYHMVSHSQREKEQSEHRKDEKVRGKGTHTFQMKRLGDIYQNPENPRPSNISNITQERLVVDANPDGSKHMQLHQKLLK